MLIFAYLKKAETFSGWPNFKKIMYFLLCTMHNKSHASAVGNKNHQCRKGHTFRLKIWLYPNHFLKEICQHGSMQIAVQLVGESFTNKTFIIGWKTF